MRAFPTFGATLMTGAATARVRAGWMRAIAVPAAFAAFAVIPPSGRAEAQAYEPGEEASALGFSCIGIPDEGYFRRQERCKALEDEWVAKYRRDPEQHQRPARPAVTQAPRTGSVPSRIIGSGGIANSGVNFGASIETVRQSLAGRPVEVLPALHHGNWYRLVANGRFLEIDPRVIRLSYEFDAPEGPSATLIGIILTYARDNSSQSLVYSERVSALSKRYPLALQSPGQMEASVAGMVICLIDDSNWSQVHEVYRKR